MAGQFNWTIFIDAILNTAGAAKGVDSLTQKVERLQAAGGTLSNVKFVWDKGGNVEKVSAAIKPIPEDLNETYQKMGNVEKALRRVAIVVPIWMAARAAISLVTTTISGGMKAWEDFERAMIKAKAVIQGVGVDANKVYPELEQTIRKFSQETGVSLDKLAATFYRFGTIGIEFKDSMSGMIAATKLAIATQGDSDTIARSMAMTYKLLGNTMDETLTPMQRQEQFAGKIFKLWQSNAFESNEYAQSLQNFISTANVANFTVDQTITLLASLGSAGVQGARGGTLLRTSIFKLVENLDVLARSLGLAVNPEMETTFDLFVRVLDTINALSRTRGIPSDALASIEKIFGGVRGAQAVTALNALLPELKKNLVDMAKDPQVYIKGLNERVGEVKNSLSGQLDILKNNKKLIGEAFVQGVLGGKDFNDSLKVLNRTLIDNLENIRLVGDMVRNILISIPTAGIGLAFDLQTKAIKDRAYETLDVNEKIATAMKGQITIGQLESTIADVKYTKDKILLVNKQKILEVLDTTVRKMIEENMSAERIQQIERNRVKNEEQIASEIGIQRDALNKLSESAKVKLALAAQEQKYQEMQIVGLSRLDIENAKLDDTLAELVNRYNNLTTAAGKVPEPINIAAIKTLILSGNIDKASEAFTEMALTEKEITGLADAYINISKERVTLAEKLIQQELDLAKIRGATNLQLLDEEERMKAMIFGENAVLNSLDLRLEREKELTREKYNQNKLSSESINLYKVATRYGGNLATTFAYVLQGQKQITDLTKREQNIFQKMFGTEFEQLSAKKFFESLAGAAIPIREKVGISGIRIPEVEGLISKLAVPTAVPAPQMATFSIQSWVTVEPIQVQVDLASEDVISKVQEAILTELENTKSDITRQIMKQIEEF
jgi:TP901 family phage tail tape measure protein